MEPEVVQGLPSRFVDVAFQLKLDALDRVGLDSIQALISL